MSENERSDMNESQIADALATTVAMITDDLTDIQLRSLNLCMQLGANPRGEGWTFSYSAVAPLFTEANGTRMEQAVKEALVRVVAERFGGAR